MRRDIFVVGLTSLFAFCSTGQDGDPSDYPAYRGPQGDVRYVFNYVRCVRDID